MRALTVQNPPAWGIAYADKNPENRPIRTNYRGPLAIHAGKAEYPINDDRPSRWEAHLIRQLSRQRKSVHSQAALHARGAFIAVVDLVGCHRCDGSCSPWAIAWVWHWELANVRPLADLIPARGMPGMWIPAPHLRDQLQAVGAR